MFCQKHFILRLGYFFLSLQNINLETSEMQKCDGDDKSFDRSFGSSAQFVVHFLSDLTWDIIGFSQHPLRYYDIFIAILIFIFRLFGVLFNDYYHWSSHTRIWIGKGVFFYSFYIWQNCMQIYKSFYRSVSHKWASVRVSSEKVWTQKSMWFQFWKWSLPNNSILVRFFYELSTAIAAATAPTVSSHIPRVYFYFFCACSMLTFIL